MLRKIRPWHAAVLWCLLLTPLLSWGLPSSRNDRFLFGGDPPWPAERYNAARALRELRERNAGADTDLDPQKDRTQIVDLTPDDAHRGEILLRYRLYSHQPDEMITFRALQRMRPRQFDFDPRLYQYGGGYIYLIGAALGAAAVTGFAEISSDLNVYLTTPELFGRFYVVARAVSVVFAGFALVAAFRLAARAGGRFAGWSALLLLATSPVYLSGALEAKPHVPAAAMGLWTIEFALRLRRSGSLRDAIKLGAAAGYALGLVLTGAASLLTVLATGWYGLHMGVQKTRLRARVCMSLILAAMVYIITNAYVLLNFATNRAALSSNVANSTAMYSISRIGEGGWRVGALLIESLGALTLAAGGIGFGWLLVRHRGPAQIGSASAVGLLLLGCAIAAGKPAEFARFLVLPASLLCVAAAVAIARLARGTRILGLVVLLACAIVAGGRDYAAAFREDAAGRTDSRTAAAEWLARHCNPEDSIGVFQEPAPYCVPPVDFSKRSIVLLPFEPLPGIPATTLPTWLVFADDYPLGGGQWSAWCEYYEIAWSDPIRRLKHGSPITWASKPMMIYRRKPG